MGDIVTFARANMLAAAMTTSLAGCALDTDSEQWDVELGEENVDSVDQALPYYLGSSLGSPLWTSSSCGAANTYKPTCVFLSEAPDRSYLWSAPRDGKFTFSTMGSNFDTVLSILSAVTGDVLACNDDAQGTVQSAVKVSLKSGQQVVIVIDGFRTSCGTFNINITE